MQSAQFEQLLAVCPNVLFNLTGIRAVDTTYQMSVYGYYDGSNELEEHTLQKFIYEKDGKSHQIGYLAAVTLVGAKISQAKYKAMARQASELEAKTHIKKFDMSMPLEAYNALPVL